MKSHIVEDGPERLRQSDDFQARLRQLRESIRTRYGPDLSQAGLLRRCWLRWRMAADYRRERRRIVPSPHSLCAGHITASGSGRV